MKSLIALLLLTTAAHAEPKPCAPHDEQVRFLTEQFGEALLGSGDASQGRKMEFWGNYKTNTWTFVLITPEGIACLMTAGGNLKLIPPGEPA